ncbi:MAG TPA: SsgA family sporulation/cell division regulator [Nocardioidaceae bacterium]|nr:SsgA family sporulation/cell division regulator [Nocardioidaceae bacterium]
MDTTRLAAQTLTQPITAAVRSIDGLAVPVSAELRYSSSDPYALTIAFHLGGGTVPWIFARDLLDGGLAEPTGDGDVHVWPCDNDEGDPVVTVELCSLDGDALVEVRAEDAAAFLRRTHSVVAAGAESAHLDFDALFTALLGTENA